MSQLYLLIALSDSDLLDFHRQFIVREFLECNFQVKLKGVERNDPLCPKKIARLYCQTIQAAHT